MAMRTSTRLDGSLIVSVKNCDTSHNDETLFNPANATGEYTLDLQVPLRARVLRLSAVLTALNSGGRKYHSLDSGRHARISRMDALPFNTSSLVQHFDPLSDIAILAATSTSAFGCPHAALAK